MGTWFPRQGGMRERGEVTLMLWWLTLPRSSVISSSSSRSTSSRAYSQFFNLPPHYRRLEDCCLCSWGEAAADKCGLISFSSERRLLAEQPCSGLPALSGVWGNPPHLMSGRKVWGRTHSVLWLVTWWLVFWKPLGTWSPALLLLRGGWQQFFSRF